MKRTDNEPASRVRNRQQTETILRLALTKIRDRGEKLSTSSLAKEANVTAALIHNRYPHFAEEIRAATGKDARSKLKATKELLTEEHTKNRELRDELENLRKEIVDLASINESLRAELAFQSAISSGKVSKISN